MSTSLIGPMAHPHEDYHLCVDGCLVPNVRVTRSSDGQWRVCLDNRFMIEVEREELDRWGWLLANAQAIGAGYSCHGPNSRRTNPYAVQAMRIDSVESSDQLPSTDRSLSLVTADCDGHDG